MASFKSWIHAARPRTLPLALSGIVMGCGLAWFAGEMRWAVALPAVVTAALIQVFSNFANDYGDFHRGTDNSARLGPARTMQSGAITTKEMKWGMATVGILAFLSGTLLVYLAAWHRSALMFACFIVLGIIALLAAYFYTAGSKPYGYAGLGDLSVMVFFGILPVAGVFYLNAGHLAYDVFLPAVSIGCFSTGVLNLNNMRDIDNDRASGKITVAVRLGRQNSMIYHIFLILCGWAAALVYVAKEDACSWKWMFVAVLPLFINDLWKVVNIKNNTALDPFLKRLSLSTLVFTLLFCAGMIISKQTI